MFCIYHRYFVLRMHVFEIR